MATRVMNTNNRLVKFIHSLTLIEGREFKPVMVSFVFVFLLMAAYYMLRPLRDAMASDWSNSEISVLWNIQFILSLLAVALLGLAVSRVRFRYLVQGVYVFFAISFVGFQWISATIEDQLLINKGFYLWVSLFSLFHVSVFWSFMADLYTREQSKRLFAFIAVGASAGALAGPIIAAWTVRFLGVDTLIVMASLILLVPVPLVLYLQGWQTGLAAEHASGREILKVGGASLAGFKLFFASPYMIGIAVFIFLFTAIGSFTYFEQTNLLRAYNLEQRTEILASLSFLVNALTFVLGFFATGHLVTRLGMPATLALMPVFMCAAFLVLAFAPVLTVLLALQVARQAGNYGITRPAREMLFTAVSRESRFKAKPVVDVVMYRGGDAIWGMTFAGLTDVLGLGLAAMGAIGAGLAALWAFTGVYLGRAFNRSLPDQSVTDAYAEDRKPVIV